MSSVDVKDAGSRGAGVRADGLIRSVTQWRPGERPIRADGRSVAPDGIRWIDLDAREIDLDREQAQDRAPAVLLEALNPLCHDQLDRAMVEDLLDVKDKREGERYSEGRIRSLSSFRVKARRLTQDVHGKTVSAGGELVFEPVEFLVGEDWLITCWHAPRVYRGKKDAQAEASEDHEELFEAVGERWSAGKGKTAADLAVLLLYELSLSYAPAHRAVRGWLEEWELQLYLDDRLDREGLKELWGSMTLLREWINPLNRAGLRADLNKAWFCGCTDHQEVINVDDRVDRALESLRTLSDTLRASFNVLQARIVEEQRDRREVLQRRIEIAAAAFLVPTLIVGFYGANTKLPGGQSWTGFWEMVVSILVLSGLAVLGVLLWQRRERHHQHGREDERRRSVVDLGSS